MIVGWGRRGTAFLAALALVVVGAVALRYGPVVAHDDGGTYCARPAEATMLGLINDFRAGRGLDPLTLSRPLGAAARHKSQEMAIQGYVAHTSPDGVTPRELLRRHGYDHNTVIGENIAAGQESAEATFEQWRESDPHRELLLDEEFAAVGIARAYDVESRFDWYWAAEFGGVLAEPAQPCAATPAAAGSPAAGATPVHLSCEGAVRDDGTYNLTCREA